MDDEAILALLWERAESAISALAAKFGRRLHQTAMNILDDRQDAEEAVNDTYMALWNTIPPERPSPLGGFVYRVGRNIALNRLRSNTAKKRDCRYALSLDELAEAIPGGTLEEVWDAKALGQAIDRFLDALNPTNRRLFLRRYWFGDSAKALAQEEGMTQNALCVRLSRIRTQLKDYLIQEGFYEP